MSPAGAVKLGMRVAVVSIAVVSVVAAIASIQPPAAVGAGAPAGDFSAERAQIHIRALASAPRPAGSPGHARARSYLVEALKALGLTPEIQETSACTTVAGTVRCGRVANVCARLAGRGAPGALLLSAHYDSVLHSPGAGDNAAGVAVLLETARALRAGPAPSRDIIFLFTDQEENQLLGAAAFVGQHPWRRDVALVLNFDARGTGGPAVLYELPPRSDRLVREIGRTVSRVTSSSFMTVLSRLVPNGTDSLVFTSAGLPVLSFAFVEGYDRYHRATDVPANLEPAASSRRAPTL